MQLLHVRSNYNDHGIPFVQQILHFPDFFSLFQQTGEGSSTDMLVPIVIGVLVAVIIIVVLIFFFVKKRKTNQKYDAVQQTNGLENGTEETEKLNDDPAV